MVCERSSSLASAVFGRIMDGLAARREAFARSVATGYSFEEWLVWEAFLACSEEKGWQVSPRPAYASVGGPGSADFGDLLVRRGMESVIVEMGLVHDYSGDFNARRLEADARKLQGPFGPGAGGLQIILCASQQDLRSEPTWQGWLSRLETWNRPPLEERFLQLPPGGGLIARAWG